ncbi:MAG: CBS domain-containing protein [Nanoarchaeota archaeon]|nr:CBS domain-containing protein [Nanoarchaeota archaeon]
MTLISDVMIREVVTADPEETISKIISKMNKYDVKELPIIDNKKKVLGMITLRSLLDIKAPAKMKVKNLSFKTPTLSPDDTIDTLITVMVEAGLEALPITRNEILVGFVSEYDVLKNLLESGFIQKYFVQNWMVTSFPTLKKKDELEKAKRLMRLYNLGVLPITDEEEFYDSSIFLMDIMKKTFIVSQKMGRGDAKGESKPLLESRVADLASSETPNINPKEEITSALKKLLDYKMKGAVILENNKPVGILRRRDILYRLAKEFLQKGVMVEFLGLKLDWEVLGRLKDLISENVRKTLYFISFDKLKVHVKAIHDIERKKYEIRVQASRPGKTYNIKKEGWDIHFTMEDALRQLETIARKEKG